MKIRRRTVELFFGTLKYWMGSTHLLIKTLKHVPTEVSLHVLAHDLKRLMSLLGLAETMKVMDLRGREPPFTCPFEAQLPRQLSGAGIRPRRAYWLSSATLDGQCSARLPPRFHWALSHGLDPNRKFKLLHS